MNFKHLILFVFIISLISCNTKSDNGNEYENYLFTYFTGNTGNKEAIRYALSNDGYNYYALNNDEPIISSEKISSTGGVRDPHILRGADGKTFYMVVTDMVSANGWSSNRAMVLLKSTDLINWTSSVVNIQKRFENQEDLLRVWAPQTIYDPVAKKYMIYFSMKHGNDNDKIYYAYANKDFTDLESKPKQLLYKDGACIDGDIILKDGKYHLFFKNEDDGAKGIMQAVSDSLTSGYKMLNGYMNVTDKPVEGSGIFKMIDSNKYILMYDMYTSGKYQFTESTDLTNFKVVDDAISMNFHPRHGTIIPITKTETNLLLEKWGGINKSSFLGFNSEKIKKNNVVIDDVNESIFIPVKHGTDLKSLNPDITLVPWMSSTFVGPQDFSNGNINYTITSENNQKTYKIITQVNNNPVLDGFYADPEIIYSNKTNKYYLYPTSDGFTGWSGTYFKTFSSIDLVNWTDEGVILDLKKDVSWTNRNAWAPATTEKKINGEYKYFYYFTAAQKIGVAVSDNPAGPFIDSGKPLVSTTPKGVKGGQEIDPDIFIDPISGKNFLYWGNGHMACVELNDDMVSIKENTLKILTPDNTFREGTEVFYRKGLYYFLWSEDDTRSPNYRVRYATSSSPTGPLTIPKNNLILEKKPEDGIYGTGHNSVIQTPNTDTWHIVYHRFNRPNGITMGDAAGYNREVCIDLLEFNADGSIIPVTPTLKGIDTLK
ncbi:family 43 glycosylhydrolase [Flavobacteriaceae bacterium MEBiC06508]